MPTGRLIGQAILHDQSHGQGNDAMRVMGLGQSVVRRVCVEDLAAHGAAVPRVDQMDVARPRRNQIAHVMQDARNHTVTKAALPTVRTRATLEVATALNDRRWWQIFWLGNTLGGVFNVLPGTRHGNALLGQESLARNLRHLLAWVTAILSLMMLKTPKERRRGVPCPGEPRHREQSEFRHYHRRVRLGLRWRNRPPLSGGSESRASEETRAEDRRMADARPSGQSADDEPGPPGCQGRQSRLA